MQLQQLGMDWELPEYAPLSDSERAAVAVEVDPGVLRPRAFKNDRDAVAAFSAMLALQPFNAESYLQRGMAHGRLLHRAEALRDYAMFLALTPADDKRRAEIHCRRANNYDKLHDTQSVLAALAETTGAPIELIPWPEQYARQCNEVAWHYVQSPNLLPLPDGVLAVAARAVQFE